MKNRRRIIITSAGLTTALLLLAVSIIPASRTPTWRTENETSVETTRLSDMKSEQKQTGEQPESRPPRQQAGQSASQTQPGTQLSQRNKQRLGVEGDVEEKRYYTLATPNDPIYPQWYTNNISAPSGWDITTGTNSTIVAVVDTGFALEHEDLKDAWYTNPGEQGLTQDGDTCWSGTQEDKQTNGCDDDANGYVDDWRGWDFANADSLPQAGENYANGNSHGTKVAGLVGARGNNGLGVASVNWQTTIMPLQGLLDEGHGSSSDIANAILYAVDHGAGVINLSIGTPVYDELIWSAVRYAADNGVIVVAASGNCGDGQDTDYCSGYPSPGGMAYPARYRETIAVGATTQSDARASFSSYGPELDLVAPGSGTIRTPTWSTTNGTTAYSSSSYGTSFASPIVSGMVGLIKGQFSALHKDEVLALLINASDNVAGMNGQERTDQYGHGRLNVNSTLQEIDVLRAQLNKAGGWQASLQTDNLPLLSTNRGHSSNTAISSSNPAWSVCTTQPNTACRLRLEKKDGTQTADFGTRKANSQGVVSWRWSTEDLSSTGTWIATVTSNGKTSSSEVLIVK